MSVNSETARSQILQRLRAAAQNHSGATKTPPNKNAAAEPNHQKTCSSALLADRLRNNRFEVICTKGQSLRQTLCEIVKQIGTDSPKHWLLGNDSFHDTLGAELTKLDQQIVSKFDKSFEHLKETIFNEVDIGLTRCAAMIKETGTIVIKTSSTEPRTLSLVPPIHVIMAEEAPTFESLSQYFDQEMHNIANDSSNMVFVSSPSKTADIQQKLAFGAHGPKRVIVVISSNQNSEELAS